MFDTLPSTSDRDICVYETSLLIDVTERPGCSLLVLSLLERCAHMLYMFSRAEAFAIDAAGTAARQAARGLYQFGIDVDWFHLTDQLESVLPDNFDAIITEVVSD